MWDIWGVCKSELDYFKVQPDYSAPGLFRFSSIHCRLTYFMVWSNKDQGNELGEMKGTWWRVALGVQHCCLTPGGCSKMPFFIFFCIVISKSVPGVFQYKSTAICNGNKAQKKENCSAFQEWMDFGALEDIHNVTQVRGARQRTHYWCHIQCSGNTKHSDHVEHFSILVCNCTPGPRGASRNIRNNRNSPWQITVPVRYPFLKVSLGPMSTQQSSWHSCSRGAMQSVCNQSATNSSGGPFHEFLLLMDSIRYQKPHSWKLLDLKRYQKPHSWKCLDLSRYQKLHSWKLLDLYQVQKNTHLESTGLETIRQLIVKPHSLTN